MRRRLLFALILAAAVVLLMSGQALGGRYLNTLEPTASMHGRNLQATVIFGCDAGQRLSLRVTASQLNVGAVAEGRRITTCTGAEQHIPVDLTTHGRLRFVPSAAATADQAVEVCVLSITATHGHADDSHQWCKPLTLVEES